jgi:hypothetical protein
MDGNAVGSLFLDVFGAGGWGQRRGSLLSPVYQPRPIGPLGPDRREAEARLLDADVLIL